MAPEDQSGGAPSEGSPPADQQHTVTMTSAAEAVEGQATEPQDQATRRRARRAREEGGTDQAPAATDTESEIAGPEEPEDTSGRPDLGEVAASRAAERPVRVIETAAGANDNARGEEQ